MYSWKYNILGTLLRHNVGSLQDSVIVHLGLAVLLPRGRSFGYQLRGVHFRLVHLGVGEGHSRAFDADRPLDDVKPRAGTDQPLHESEVAARNSFGNP